MLLRLTDQRPDLEIQKSISAVMIDAVSHFDPLTWEGEFPITGYGIQELRPKHVYSTAGDMYGSAAWSMSAAAASTWYDWINTTTTDMAYLIVIGAFNLSANPQVAEIKPQPNGQEAPVINLEQMYALDLARVFFQKPFAVKPESPFVMRDMALAATAPERLGLLGYCIAKRAYLIKE